MKKIFIFGLACMMAGAQAIAGNPERAGQAGATQLLINPWARSSGVNGINVASSYGIESIINNPAGLSLTKRTELVFSHTRYLVGTDININSFGFSQGLKKAGVLGIYVTAFDLGDFIRTTEANPDGGLGTFSPTYMNMGVSYAKKFTEKIHVGATMKLIHESIPDASANGVAFDAGVQYRTSFKKDDVHADRLKLGISLRNIGTTMKFGGDGLTFRATRNPNFTSLASRPTASFEMPSVLNMGVSYDMYFGGDAHRVTPMGAFISNTFSRDQMGVGLEYGFKQYLMLRYSFLYEKDILNENRLTAWTGHSLGATVEIPFKSGKDMVSKFGLDYSYRSTNPFNGTHCLGVRIDL